MASEELRAVFNAVETISQTLDDIGRSVTSLQADFSQLDGAMSGNTAVSQAQETQLEGLGSTIDDVSGELDEATRSLSALTGMQNVNVATAATQSGSMEVAAQAIDEAGDEALTTAAQMGVLDTVMKELSLSGSALSVNIGAFNVSLRNLAPLVPIAASMGSVVTVAGAFVSAIGAATVAWSGFVAAGAVGFMDEMESKFAGLTDTAETLEAVMAGIRDLFMEALEPLQSAENTEFFVNTIEGIADLVNRLAQAISQMRDTFMPLFSGISDIVSSEFDNVANAIEDMMETMTPVLLNFFEWFMQKLPDALRFMARITRDLAGPIGNLGDSLLNTLTSIIETATAIFQGLGPAFAVALDFVTELIDVFNAFSNGILQATIFIGGLTLAAVKFVGIADTIANVGITAANRWVQFGRQASSSMAGAQNAVASFANESFKHLQALGKVLTGQMTLADAAGQTHKNLADDIQEAATNVSELEDKLERVKSEYAQLVATVEGTSVGDEIADEVNHAADEADQAADRISRMSGIEVAPEMGGFRDMETGQTVAKELAESQRQAAEQVVDANDRMAQSLSGGAMAEGFEGLDDVAEESTGGIRSSVGSLKDGVGNAARAIGGQLRGLGARFASFSDTMAGPFRSAAASARDSIAGIAGSLAEAAFQHDANVTKVGALVTNFDELAQSAIESASAMVAAPFKKLSSGAGRASDSLYQMFLVNDANVTKMGALVTNLDRMAQSAIESATAAFKAVGGYIKMGLAAAWSKVQLVGTTLATHGLIGSLQLLATSLWGSVSGFGAIIIGALSTAATFVGGLIPATLSTGTALNVAFAGIPALLGLIVSAGALVVGVLGNMDSVTSGLKGGFDRLKNALSAIGNSIMKAAVPAWNLFIDIIEALIAPVFAIWDGLMMIGKALGIVSGEGGSVGGVLSVLMAGFDGLMAIIGSLLDFIAPVFSLIANLLYRTFILPFKVIADAINLVISIFQTFFSLLMKRVPFVQAIVDTLVSGFREFVDIILNIPSLFQSAFDMAAGIVEDIMDFMIDLVQPVVDKINSIIEASNDVLGTNFDKLTVERDGREVSRSLSDAQTSASEVRENARSDSEEPGDEVATEPNVNLSLEDSVENNVEVQADPEDQAQLSRLTKDALKEANSFARRQQGGQ